MSGNNVLPRLKMSNGINVQAWASDLPRLPRLVNMDRHGSTMDRLSDEDWRISLAGRSREAIVQSLSMSQVLIKPKTLQIYKGHCVSTIDDAAHRWHSIVFQTLSGMHGMHFMLSDCSLKMAKDGWCGLWPTGNTPTILSDSQRYTAVMAMFELSPSLSLRIWGGQFWTWATWTCQNWICACSCIGWFPVFVTKKHKKPLHANKAGVQKQTNSVNTAGNHPSLHFCKVALQICTFKVPGCSRYFQTCTAHRCTLRSGIVWTAPMVLVVDVEKVMQWSWGPLIFRLQIQLCLEMAWKLPWDHETCDILWYLW